ncbi:MAG: transposase [Planctomycetaceae bacterium]
MTHWPTGDSGPLVQNLQAFCGIQELTAVGIVAEIVTFERFPTAAKFMSFVGWFPAIERSNTSSGWDHQERQPPCATSADRSSLALLSCPTKREPRTVTAARVCLRRSSTSPTTRCFGELRKRSLKLQRIKVCHEDRHRGWPAVGGVPVVRRDHHAASASRTDFPTSDLKTGEA